MKSFSEIRNKLKDYGYLGESHIPSRDVDKMEDLKESWGVGVQPYPSADGVESGNLLNLNDEATFDRLNAFVGSISHRDYIDPRVAVGNLRNKLQTVGLDFELGESSIGSGKLVLVPLYRFGYMAGLNLDGSWMKNAPRAVDEQSDYMLEMSFEKMLNGLTSINAMVKKMNRGNEPV
jgi:hypothetical protein